MRPDTIPTRPMSRGSPSDSLSFCRSPPPLPPPLWKERAHAVSKPLTDRLSPAARRATAREVGLPAGRALQGYLTHKKSPPPPSRTTRPRPNVGCEGEAFSYERGTPVGRAAASERLASRGKSHLETLLTYKLGFDQKVYTLALISQLKIVMCSKFH